MSVVFELYNADGSLQFDMTRRITRILTQVQLTAGQAGSVAVSGLEKGTFFYYLSLSQMPTTAANSDWPAITRSGSSISWTAPAVSMVLIIGVY